MNKNYFGIFVVFGLFLFGASFVSAISGLGVGYSSQSFMAEEGQSFCLDYYKVYNPWDESTYVTVDVSDELKEIMVRQDTSALLVPAQTSSKEAIPLNQFCFKIPKVYERDYMIAGRFVDELDCGGQDMKVYEGEIVISKAPAPAGASEGVGGSVTKSSISAPLKIRVECLGHGPNYSLVYIVLAIFSAGVVLFVLVRRYRKPAIERDREKLAKLKKKIASSEKRK